MHIDSVYVSTMMPQHQIMEQSVDRPETLSGDHEPTISALKHKFRTIETAKR
jgi:hypothetical protein